MPVPASQAGVDPPAPTPQSLGCPPLPLLRNPGLVPMTAMIRVAVSEVAVCASPAIPAQVVVGLLAQGIAKAEGAACRVCASAGQASQAPIVASVPALGAAAREDAARTDAVCATRVTLVRIVV